MPEADFFARLGLYVQKNFLDADLCRMVRAEMSVAESKKALTVRHGTGESVLDEDFRNCWHSSVTKSTRRIVEEGIKALRPALEEHFTISLSGYEKPSFLLYRNGDFFAPHIDVRKSPDPSTPENVMTQYTDKRKISIILFLNRHSEDAAPDSFSGGSLVLYGLLDKPDLTSIGFPLVAEEGLLVAFRSDLMHEVKAVTGGERYTAVSWFS